VTRRLVLFDIDGTLLLSGGAGRRAILAAIAEEGVEPEMVGHVRFDGKTDPQIVAELLDAGCHRGPYPPERIEAVIDRYLANLEADLAVNAHQATVMPGVRPLLDLLHEDERIVLGLLTGNVVRGARLKLEAVGLGADRFLVGAYGSDHGIRSELPPIAAARAVPHFGRVPGGPEIVIIGDTPADVTCGQCVGARSVAVATGGYTVDDLAGAGAHRVFPDLSDIATVHAAIFGD